MSSHRNVRFGFLIGIIAFVILVAGRQNLLAQESVSEVAAKRTDDVATLAAMIDHHLARRWKATGVTTAPLSDDAEFLRRVSLDIGGKIPSVTTIRDFLDDNAPDKRRKMIDRLLESSGYVTHFTNMWRKVMMPESAVNFNVRFLIPGFEAWLREKLTDNVQYDELVYELLTASLDRSNTVSPLAFYEAKEIKPENLAASTSRMFLVIRIECAQCHDHPFDRWKRDEFWKFATFYAGLERRPRSSNSGVLGSLRELFKQRTLTIPDTQQVVSAVFLDGKEPQIDFGQSARVTLAEWITSRDNPYFARTAVNRIWGHFFGLGIVDPVDDFTSSRAPSHPELLDELAREFSEHDFDLKFLIRGITASRAYQLSSSQTHENQADQHLFGRMQVKGMASEQFFDSLAQAIGYQQQFNARERFNFRSNTPRSKFLERFANDNHSPTERQTSILQALAMMNGQFIADATSLEKSRTLAAVADYPDFTTADRVETLFLATLSRKPKPDELSRFVKYVNDGGPRNNPEKELAGVFWILLNSSEFMFNHLFQSRSLEWGTE